MDEILANQKAENAQNRILRRQQNLPSIPISSQSMEEA